MSEEIQIPTAWIESGKQGETLYNKKALRHACNQTLDAFVAELERGIDEQIETFERTAMSCQGSYVATQQFSFLEQSEDFQTKADTLKEFKLKIQQTAKRMKGDV
jgi:hypothetical protein